MLKPRRPSLRSDHPRPRTPRQSRQKPKIAFARVLVPALLLHGCTCIEWTDSEGYKHHLGLVANYTTRYSSGTASQTYALGAMLRLSSDDAGYGVGYRSVERISNDPVRVTGADLAQAVEDSMSAARSPAGPSEGSWQLFYFVTPPVPEFYGTTTVVGLDLGLGTCESGLCAGYARASGLLSGLPEDTCLVLSRDANGAVSGISYFKLTH